MCPSCKPSSLPARDHHLLPEIAHINMQPTILIIEDDANTAALIMLYCEREGFKTLMASDGATGLQKAVKQNPDLVVLDLMLPKMDGWDVCRQLRQKSDIPIIMLTARGDEIDRVSGLSLGADDYVVKPFSPRELVERIKAVLRRTRRIQSPEKQVLSHLTLRLDLHNRRVSVDNRSVDLTPHEYRLLETLMKPPEKVQRGRLLAMFATRPGGERRRLDSSPRSLLRRPVRGPPTRRWMRTQGCRTRTPSRSRRAGSPCPRSDGRATSRHCSVAGRTGYEYCSPPRRQTARAGPSRSSGSRTSPGAP